MTTTPPPAGWYPAIDGSNATWWWDGERWSQPPAQAQPQQVPVQNPAANAAIAKLATATQVLLIVCGVISVAIIGTEVFGIIAVGDFLAGGTSSIDMLDAYDRNTAVTSVLSSVVLIATGVLWAVWQYRAAKTVVGLTRRSPGWHAGSWFIPVISLWFPFQNISDLWRAVGRVRPAWSGIWWFLWLACNVVIQMGTRVYLAAVEIEQFRVAMWLSLIGEVLLVAAVPLAWLVVRGITQGILERPAVPAQSTAV